METEKITQTLEAVTSLSKSVDQLEKRIAELEQRGIKTTLLIGDVATLTGLSKSHIYKLTCTNQIPHYKPSGKYLYFDKAEIERWMKRGKVQTTDEAKQESASYIVRKSLGV